ncbi:hypothetical protein ONZ45_g13608 [Pleurotus djamor]|nr:hypothetical protein ONZ45_g13608 [Pleurotus djamor]
MLGNFALAVYRSGTLAGDVQPATVPSPERMKPAISSRSYTSRDQFATFQEEVDKEELRAFYASLTVAWSLFIVFWVVGTAIFHVTEGWPFGATMYFCFTAFMTIGYGDFAPETPTGRSIFVVWALLGIATMTILISIVSEAYTYRYKTMLRSRPFQKAVKRYRAEKARHKPPPFGQERPTGLGEGIQECLGRSDQKHANEDELNNSIRAEAMREKRGNKDQDVQARLEALPKLILEHTKVFQEHVRYFTGNGRGKGNGGEGDRVPEGVRALVDNIAGTEKLGERMKSEMLQDDDSRQTLFALGIEEEIRKIVRIAEDTLKALEESNAVLQLCDHNETSPVH